MFFNFWRPITAIRLGNTDNNPQTIADANWTPLITTPNYPDFTSGANSVTGAATRALELFFGRGRLDFTLTTTNTGPTNQDTRSYRRFSEAADEVVDARVWLGIHFRFADTVAREQGEQVANWVFENYLQRIGHGHNGGDDPDSISEPQIDRKGGLGTLPAPERLSTKMLRIIERL